MSACPPIPLKKPYFMPFSSQPKYLLRSPSKAFPCLASSLQVPILTFKKGIHLEKVPALSQTIVTERLILCDITSFHCKRQIIGVYKRSAACDIVQLEHLDNQIDAKVPSYLRF